MACPSCLVAISGIDGLPSSGRSFGEAAPPAPAATASTWLALAGGALVGYLVLRAVLPSAGRSLA